MNKLSLDYLLTNIQKEAITELKKKIEANYSIANMIIFGSVARKEADKESDLDLLILTKEKATHKFRNKISDIVFEINLKYNSNISIVVLEQEDWNKGITQITPFYKEVKKDGVYVK